MSVEERPQLGLGHIPACLPKDGVQGPRREPPVQWDGERLPCPVRENAPQLGVTPAGRHDLEAEPTQCAKDVASREPPKLRRHAGPSEPRT